MTRVLVLGATGMLGNAVFTRMSGDARLEVWGTVRSDSAAKVFPQALQARIITGIDALDDADVKRALDLARAEVIVNCVGLVKQLDNANDPLAVLLINSMLPHRLARFSEAAGARLVHINTECVLPVKKGNDRESDPSDAEDIYGKSKYVGEVSDRKHVVTLRTSISGHGLHTAHGLIASLLSTSGDVKGYETAIFSGLPTVELSRVIQEFVIPKPRLSGLYNVSAKPISKLALLRLVANVYGKKVNIIPDGSLVIDRSLNSALFSSETGYVARSGLRSSRQCTMRLP